MTTENSTNSNSTQGDEPAADGPLWREDSPPNEVWVEVLDGIDVIQAMAFFGRDGYRPHWRLRDESCVDPFRFSKWRELPVPSEPDGPRRAISTD